jgi:hypothetical protein
MCDASSVIDDFNRVEPVSCVVDDPHFNSCGIGVNCVPDEFDYPTEGFLDQPIQVVALDADNMFAH